MLKEYRKYDSLSYTSFVIQSLSREHMNSQLTLLPVCGFIAQLVEHRTGNAEVTGSNPVEALNFFQASLQLLKLQTQLRGSFLHFTFSIRSSQI